jgi:rare lipoprotein A (peptidoglycan hydrolase)
MPRKGQKLINGRFKYPHQARLEWATGAAVFLGTITAMATLKNYSLNSQILKLQQELSTERGAKVETILRPCETAENGLDITISGQASYYSEDGCLGCNDELRMANNEILDDDVRTIALTPETVSQYKLLNDKVIVRNASTGATTTARVTDTGGFAKYDRVADLSVATKEAINCGDLCEVEITIEYELVKNIKEL